VTTSSDRPARVAIIGCGLIGGKRAHALGGDSLVGVFDTDRSRAARLAEAHGTESYATLDELLALEPEIVVVATIHNALAENAIRALEAGAHVLVEKPAGIGVAEIDAIALASRRADRLVKVGFNHRFHPGIARAIAEARSGVYGEVLSLRGRYGHGGRLGYDREWRADPALSGGGEVVDQGMHLLDLSFWLHGALSLHSSLLRTQYWQMPVDDNAVIVLGEQGGVGSAAPFSLLHVSWTEWKNTFSIEIACRTAKISVDGLGGSYGTEHLRIYKMKPELGPPDLEEIRFEGDDTSWTSEWEHFRSAIERDEPARLLGDLGSARYCWEIVEAAQGAK
jgi:predicted dehydrogenase